MNLPAELLDSSARQADVLVTGFPGFLASHLLERLIPAQPDAKFILLIQEKMRSVAVRHVERLRLLFPSLAGRVELVSGDLTRDRLGLEDRDYARLTQSVGVVWHLAAIYDLAVAERVAYMVNVRGTANVLDFCAACDDFHRLNYISTCYVSGERVGLIYEDELDRNQGHKNHYEETKFWAEVEVRRRADEVPSVIMRPGIVVGDSRTGETAKYDGPYYVFKLLHQLPAWVPVPRIGGGNALVNLVPIDFAADAMAYLGLAKGTAGKTFHIADPNPLRAQDLVSRTLDIMGKAQGRVTVPDGVVERLLRNQEVEQRVGVPREALIYFNHDARYDTTNTQRALREVGLQCPHMADYLPVLLDYLMQHPEKPFLDDRRV